MATQHAGHLRYLNESVEIAKLPPEEWSGPLAAQRAQIPRLPVLARMLAPAVDKVAQACQRDHALLRSAIVAVAAERFRRRNGRWPAAIDEVVQAGLIKAVPRDPFDGKPLRFKRTADGLIVYAIGPDGTDDGGALVRGTQPPTGWDVGFQLWDVAARRGPPPPPKPPEPADDPNAPQPDAPPPGGAPPP
jgi:hypothetical protein